MKLQAILSALLCLSFGLIISNPAIGQGADITLSGTVRDTATTAPIAGALVTLQTTDNRTTTAADGTFSITIPDEAGVIVAASKGYFNGSFPYLGFPTTADIGLGPVPPHDDPTYEFKTPDQCGSCHPNQLSEWTGSPMADAGINTWVHDIYNGKGTPGGMGGFVYTRDSVYSATNPNSECASCHQPEPWIKDPFSRMESPDDFGYPSAGTAHGISCDVCHKIADVTVENIDYPGLHPDAATFTRPEGPSYPQVVYGTLGDVDFQIPNAMRSSYQPQLVAEVCGTCHQDKNDIHEDGTFTGVTSEPTYVEWIESPYGDPDSPLYATCVDCHMPPSGETTISDEMSPPLVRDTTAVRSHKIIGSSSAYLENAAELDLQTSVVGNELQVIVDVTNAHTGHHLPTGVTVRNMILLVEAWREDDGLDLVSTGTQTIHDLGGVGDPSQGYYAGLPGKFYSKVNHDANGNGPTFFTDATGLQFDSRIPALATDSTQYAFAVPEGGGDLRVRARLIYRRAFRFLVDAKGWTEDGHGRPLADVAAPHYGHLMEESEKTVNAPPPDGNLYRVNAGGAEYTDSSGNVWAPDTGFYTTGNASASGADIQGTADDPLYQTERWSSQYASAMVYSFPVDPGEYTVRLHFAEIYWGASNVGGRVFDVLAEGGIVLDDYDIVAAAGGFLTATQTEFTVQVTDNSLDLSFGHEVQNPKISAIEIETPQAASPPELVVQPTHLDFGAITVGGPSAFSTLTLQNSGGQPLDVTGLNVSGPQAGDFGHDGSTPLSIAPFGEVSISVEFTPGDAGIRAATLEIQSNNPGGPVSVPLLGEGAAVVPPTLTVAPPSIDFGDVGLDGASDPETVTLTNTGGQDLTVSSIGKTGSNAGDFSLGPIALPKLLSPGQSAVFDVTFSPTGTGSRTATVEIVSDDPEGSRFVSVAGVGTDLPPFTPFWLGVNAGGSDYTDTQDRDWVSDESFFNTGNPFGQGNGVAGTEDDPLYQSERWDRSNQPEMVFKAPLDSGRYDVRLHFAEIYVGAAAPGKRVFDVLLEGQMVLDDLDIYSQVGFLTAMVEEFRVDVTDGTLEIEFIHQVENPKISAIEIESVPVGPEIKGTPTSLDFGLALVGGPAAASETVTLTNTGDADLLVSGIALEGTHAVEFSSDASPPYNLTPGASAFFDVFFAPLGSGPRTATLRVFSDAVTGTLEIPLQGEGNEPSSLTLTRGSIDFGSVEVGEASGPAQVALHNQDPIANEISLIEIADPVNCCFDFSSPQLPILLGAGDAVIVDVSYAAAAVGHASALLKIHLNNGAEHFFVALSGNGFVTSPPLVASPTEIAFADTMLGDTSAALPIVVENADTVTHEIHKIEVIGNHPGDFPVASAVPPFDLGPGGTVTLSVSFQPTHTGPRDAIVKVHMDAHVFHLFVPVSGNGTAAPTPTPTPTLEGPTPTPTPTSTDPTPTPTFTAAPPTPTPTLPPATASYRVNAGGPDYTDGQGNLWEADTPYVNTGNPFTSGATIANASDQALYQSERWDPFGSPEMLYAFPVDNGLYTVTLHFAEIYGGAAFAGGRVFDVWAEGVLEIDDYDIYVDAGYLTATQRTLQTTVTDGILEIEFGHGAAQNPKISAIEVAPTGAELEVDPLVVNWGHVDPGEVGTLESILVTNTGFVDARVTSLSFLINEGVGHDFHVDVAGTFYTGGHADVTHAVDLIVPASGSVSLPVEFRPTEFEDNDVTLEFGGNFLPVQVQLRGIGGEETGHPFLHTVIRVDPYFVDYDGDGFADVFLDGSDSHTHEFGHALVAYEWSESSIVFATDVTLTVPMSLGHYEVSLTIFDDNTPPETLTATESFDVVAPDNIPGALALYYPPSEGGAAALLDATPINADYAEVLSTPLIDEQAGFVGGSSYSGDVMVRLLAQIDFPTSASVEFQAHGGTDSRLFVDGSPVVGPVALSSGKHEVEGRFAVDSVSNLPVSITYSVDGGPQTLPDSSVVTHDELGLKPVINSGPTEGTNLGGNLIELLGIGFFPADQLVVHWGDEDLSGVDLTVTPTSVSFLSPPGTGTIEVTVETPAGVSDPHAFSYSSTGPVPIQFNVNNVANLANPAQAAWGPDGRLYVGTTQGIIMAYTIDDDYNVTASQTINAVASYANIDGFVTKSILGIAFNPLEATGPPRIYVAHNALFVNGGACFTGFSPYSGQVSVLEGPNFDTVEPLVTRLPVSNHDHGINGLEFTNEGSLFILVGGNTNAGVQDCPIGDIPESPLSAALILAEISKPGFNGDLQYLETASGLVNNDQVFGDIVDVTPGVDVSVYASGFRNAFDLVLTTNGGIYVTDNGPNGGFGPASTSATTEGPDPTDQDKLVKIELGHYYGHPNRNRGRSDSRQNVYHGTADTPSGGDFTQALTTFTPSTNGICEYRANAFGGGMRGELLAQKWNGATHRVALSADGETVDTSSILPASLLSLDVLTGPGGAVLGVDYTGSEIVVAVPQDTGATGPTLYDIHPWRAPAAGGARFEIGGFAFGDLSDTFVSIGGIPADVTSVSSTRIVGTIPPHAYPSPGLVDVEVTVGGTALLLTEAFQYLIPAGADTGSRALVEIVPPGNMNNASTYGADSLKITNTSTSGQNIERVRFDLAPSLFPDNVFDPFNQAGDPVGKDVTIDTDPGVGYDGRVFLSPHDGGYDVLEMNFTDFNPGETLTFSVDIDPTNIKGAAPPGPNHSGSVSGIETIGAEILVQFDDGAVRVGDAYRQGVSVTGSESDTRHGPPGAPALEVLGLVGSAATVTQPNQTARISGPAGATARLMVVEGALYLAGVPGGGFDLDPYEANTAIAIDEIEATIGPSGYVDVPITLTKGANEGGYNHLIAVVLDGNGDAGRVSNKIVLEYLQTKGVLGRVK